MLQFPDTARKWQAGWFYCPDERTPSGHEGLPAYTERPPEWLKHWSDKPSVEEMPDVLRLMKNIKELQDKVLTDVDLIITWLDQRIQPLHARERPIWVYSGVTDCTRGSEAELSDKVFKIP